MLLNALKLNDDTVPFNNVYITYMDDKFIRCSVN